MHNENQVATTTKKRSRLSRFAGAVALASTFAIATSANAIEGSLAAPDMTQIVTMITGMVAVVASVGMAVLSVYATAKVFKWVKTAF